MRIRLLDTPFNTPFFDCYPAIIKRKSAFSHSIAQSIRAFRLVDLSG